MAFSAFSLFSALPKEMRDLIWLAALTPDLHPRAFLFSIETTFGTATYIPPESRRTIMLFPRAQKTRRGDVTSLAEFTEASRVLGLACREARAVVDRAFPDRLPFWILEDEYFLRFNAQRDVVVINMDDTRRLYEMIALMTRPGLENASFMSFAASVRNLGIEGKAWDDFARKSPVSLDEQCGCEKRGCLICAYSYGGMTTFLTCWPRLQALYVAVGADPYAVDRSGRSEPIGNCSCMEQGGGDERGSLHEWPLVKAMQRRWDWGDARHEWPFVKATQEHGDWFVSYKEGECSYPSFWPLEMIWRKYQPGWPCNIGGLKHLDLRILRRMRGGPPAPRWSEKKPEDRRMLAGIERPRHMDR